MAFEMDGLRVLRRLGKHPDLFESVRPEATKAAQALLARRLKVRGIALTEVRAVRDAVGADDFSLFLDAASDADIKSLLGKVDRHWPGLRSAGAPELRRRLLALCEGTAEAAQKKGAAVGPKGTAQAPAQAPAPAPRRRLRVMDITAMGARSEVERGSAGQPAADSDVAEPPKKGKKKKKSAGRGKKKG